MSDQFVRFWKCAAPVGCDWHVLRPQTRCRDHGGPWNVEWKEDEYGETIWRFSSGDTESSRRVETE